MRRIHQIVGVTGFRGLWAWQIGQSIGIDENITYVGVANFFLGQSIGSGRGILLGGLWALEWAWHIPVKNLRCVKATKLKSEITLLFLS